MVLGGGVWLLGALGVSLLCVGALGDLVPGDEVPVDGVLLGEAPGVGVPCWDGLRPGLLLTVPGSVRLVEG